MCYQSLRKESTIFATKTFLDAFRANSCNIIGGNPSMAIPLLANQDLTPTPMLVQQAEQRFKATLRDLPEKPISDVRISHTTLVNSLKFC